MFSAIGLIRRDLIIFLNRRNIDLKDGTEIEVGHYWFTPFKVFGN
jgi:hypothetical protein